MISFVFSTWNSRREIEKCLRSLDWLSKKEIIVVDQASTDGTVEFLRTQDNIRVVYEPVKTSWANANLKGIRLATSHWIAVSNPDIYYSPDFGRVLDFLKEESSRVKPIVSCQLRLRNGVIQSPVRNLNFWNLLAKSMSIGHLIDLFLFHGRNGRDFYYYQDWKGTDKKMIVEHPFMSFFIIHRSTLERIGLPWGSAYTWSRADSDLCKRADQHHIPIILLPVTLDHDFAHSFKNVRDRKNKPMDYSRYSLEADWAFGNTLFFRYWKIHPRAMMLLYAVNIIVQPIVQSAMGKDSMRNLIKRMSGQAKGILMAWRMAL